MSTENVLVSALGPASRRAVDWIREGMGRDDKASDLTIAILTHVANSPAIIQGELGKYLRRDPMTMSQAVRALVLKGLLRAEMDDKDRRVRRLTLTKKGQNLADSLNKAEAGLVQALTKEWGKARVSRFMKELSTFDALLRDTADN